MTLANTAGAVLDLGGASETIGSLAGGGATGGNLTLGAGTLTTGGNNSSTTFAGAISGSGGLTKTGTGVFTLTGNNTYSSVTDVQLGTLRVGAAMSIPDNGEFHVAENAELDLNDFDQTVLTLTGAGEVHLGTATLTIHAEGSSTFSGDISGDGALVLSDGTITLDGSNSYTGGTTVLNRRLRGPVGGLQGDIVNHAIVEFAQPTDDTYSGLLSGSGRLIKTGAGKLTIATPATYTGTTTISQGTLNLPNTLNTPGGAIQIEANGTLEASGIIQRAITAQRAARPPATSWLETSPAPAVFKSAQSMSVVTRSSCLTPIAPTSAAALSPAAHLTHSAELSWQVPSAGTGPF